MERASPDTLTAPAFDPRLVVTVREAVRTTELPRDRGLVSVCGAVSEVDPLALFGVAKPGDRLFWSNSGGSVSIAASGSALAVDDARSIGDGLDMLQTVCADLEPDMPCLFGAFAFDLARPRSDVWAGFPSVDFVIPELVLISDGSGARAAVNIPISRATTDPQVRERLERANRMIARAAARAGERSCEGAPSEKLGPVHIVSRDGGSASSYRRHDVPSRSVWLSQVETVKDLIAQGAAEKVAFARRVDLDVGDQIDPVAILERLEASYPEATVFAHDRGQGCFIGASPEILASVEGSQISTTCLGGSSPRGSDERQDSAAESSLLIDPKEGQEHSLVVAHVAHRLRDVCRDIHTVGPDVLTLKNLFHLRTRLRGTLLPNKTIFDTLAVLHPTPAIAGTPPDSATQIIRRLEEFDRGWYGGVVGWATPGGRAQFALAIRSALLRPPSAHLYAGCGIVSRSRPETEWVESQTKLKVMMDALTA